MCKNKRTFLLKKIKINKNYTKNIDGVFILMRVECELHFSWRTATTTIWEIIIWKNRVSYVNEVSNETTSLVKAIQIPSYLHSASGKTLMTLSFCALKYVENSNKYFQKMCSIFLTGANTLGLLTLTFRIRETNRNFPSA